MDQGLFVEIKLLKFLKIDPDPEWTQRANELQLNLVLPMESAFAVFSDKMHSQSPLFFQSLLTSPTTVTASALDQTQTSNQFSFALL